MFITTTNTAQPFFKAFAWREASTFCKWGVSYYYCEGRSGPTRVEPRFEQPRVRLRERPGGEQARTTHKPRFGTQVPPRFKPRFKRGLNPGSNPDSNPRLNPGLNPGSNPGLEPKLNPGWNPSSNPGLEPRFKLKFDFNFFERPYATRTATTPQKSQGCEKTA